MFITNRHNHNSKKAEKFHARHGKWAVIPGGLSKFFHGRHDQALESALSELQRLVFAFALCRTVIS
jgi:hypothetical protein